MNLKQMEYFVAIVNEGNISCRCQISAYLPASFKRPDETVGRRTGRGAF